MPSPPILLTGATGVLGRLIAERLLREGHSLRALVRAPAAARALLPAGVELIEGSLQDVVSLQDAVRGCRACVHVAGLVRFDDGAQQNLLDTNYGGTTAILNACLAEVEPIHFVQISSIAALPLAAADEQTVPRPNQYASYYGYTKRLAELEVNRAAAEGLGFTILRPSIVLALHPNGQSSSAITRLALRPVTVAPPGTLHWVAGADVADAVAHALVLGPQNLAYNLDAEPMPWLRLFTMLRERGGVKGGYIYPTPPMAVKLLGHFSGLFSSLFKMTVPSRSQLLHMLQDRAYPGHAEAEMLLGRPFMGVEEAVKEMLPIMGI